MPEGGSVSLRVETGTGRPFFSGCVRCNSVWECPVCAPRIMSGRAEELSRLNVAHGAQEGAQMYLATFTLPHDEGDALAPLRKHVTRAWSCITRGAPWKRWKKRLGIVGTVRSLEVTHGAHGWHPHLHVAIYSRAFSREELGELRCYLMRQWRRYIIQPTKEGRRYRPPSVSHGVTLQPLRSAEYLAKMGLASELTMATTKEGRSSNRTPWQILRDLTESKYPDTSEGEIRALDDRQLWGEYSRAMSGARQLTWSEGLRKLYSIAEVPDEQLPDTQGELETLAEGDSETVETWSPVEWIKLCKLGVAVRLALLQVPRLPREEWRGAIYRIVRRAQGLPDKPPRGEHGETIPATSHSLELPGLE